MAYCKQNNSNPTQKVVLRFKSENLLYDIRNYAYIEGHIMPDDAECSRHMTIDIGEDGNLDRVLRILSVVHAHVIEILYPYTKLKTTEEEEIDNRLWAPEEYVVELHVPETMSRTTMDLLSKLIHEFMVYRVLADWLSITYPKKAQIWLEKANEAQEEINHIKNKRTQTLRRALHPF